jgi:hypothetical protein
VSKSSSKETGDKNAAVTKEGAEKVQFGDDEDEIISNQ